MADPLYLDADVHQDYALPLQLRGHDVLTARQVGRLRAHDEEQLAFAAESRRILITHNSKDFLFLQRAWRHWSDMWDVSPRPIHPGILIIPQQSPWTFDQIAHEVNAFIRSGIWLSNRYFDFSIGVGWIQMG
jgi:hypothetical protein